MGKVLSLLKNAVARPFFHARAIYHVTPGQILKINLNQTSELFVYLILVLGFLVCNNLTPET